MTYLDAIRWPGDAEIIYQLERYYTPDVIILAWVEDRQPAELEAQ